MLSMYKQVVRDTDIEVNRLLSVSQLRSVQIGKILFISQWTMNDREQNTKSIFLLTKLLSQDHLS